MKVQTSVFKMPFPFYTKSYLVDNFFENIELPNSKFEWVGFQL